MQNVDQKGVFSDYQLSVFTSMTVVMLSICLSSDSIPRFTQAGFIEVFIETKAKCQGIPQSVVVVANDKVDLCASW